MSHLAEKRNFTIKIVINFFHWLYYQLRSILKKNFLENMHTLGKKIDFVSFFLIIHVRIDNSQGIEFRI